MAFQGVDRLPATSTINDILRRAGLIDPVARFALGLKSCSNQRYDEVKGSLIKIFESYGLPDRINTDNGPPMG
jgi:hypothetical protein